LGQKLDANWQKIAVWVGETKKTTGFNAGGF
jgi:hypothetical protein